MAEPGLPGRQRVRAARVPSWWTRRGTWTACWMQAEKRRHGRSSAPWSPTITRTTWAARMFGHSIEGRRPTDGAPPGASSTPTRTRRTASIRVTGVDRNDRRRARGAATCIEIGAIRRCGCIHTPGHTPGSQCFLVEESESVQPTWSSGDTLFLGSCGRVDLPGSDPEADVPQPQRDAEEAPRRDPALPRPPLRAGVPLDDGRAEADATPTSGSRRSRPSCSFMGY